MADGEATTPGNGESFEICDQESKQVQMEFQEDHSGNAVHNKG